MLAGPTQSGKTSLLIKILTYANEMITPMPDRIVYCYSQPLEVPVPGVELHQGLPDMDMFDANKNNILILDDLMEQCESNVDVQRVFTVDAHHKNVSTFLLTQNLYSRGKCARTISLNCNYMIIFNNPRDRLQIRNLSRQMYPGNAKFLVECYEDATESRDHGYLFLDLTQKTKQKHRVQTNILPGETRIVYHSK